MFENLTDKLERSFKILKGEGRITEINVAETLKEIPVYAFHGRQDPIVPYCASADTVSAIRAAGGKSVFFKTYERGRHNIWDKAIVFSGDERNPALGEWLFAQRKNEK